MQNDIFGCILLGTSADNVKIHKNAKAFFIVCLSFDRYRQIINSETRSRGTGLPSYRPPDRRPATHRGLLIFGKETGKVVQPRGRHAPTAGKRAAEVVNGVKPLQSFRGTIGSRRIGQRERLRRITITR